MPGKFIPMTDEMYEYVIAHRSNADDPLLISLFKETESLGEMGKLMIGPDQAGLLSLLTGLVSAKWAVEVGTFTGISSICIARYLAPGGKLFCFEQDFKATSIARRYWIRSGLQDKIDLRLGDARRLLPHFKPRDLIDLVYIDADKESYEFYFETILPYVRPGGIIVFDNMLRGGEVIHPVAKTRPVNRAIDALNRKLATDARVQSVLVPMSDGMVICRKVFIAGQDGRRPIGAHETRRLT